MGSVSEPWLGQLSDLVVQGLEPRKCRFELLDRRSYLPCGVAIAETGGGPGGNIPAPDLPFGGILREPPGPRHSPGIVGVTGIQQE